MCLCPQRPEGVKITGAGVIGGCELPDVGAEYKLRPSARIVHTLNTESSFHRCAFLLNIYLKNYIVRDLIFPLSDCKKASKHK